MNPRLMLLPCLLLLIACDRTFAPTEPLADIQPAKGGGGGGKTQWIVFESDRMGGSVRQIYRVKAGGGEVEQLTHFGEGRFPSWSPGGRKIAFASARQDSWDIYQMDANGRNQRRITTDPATDVMPDWSPDGTRISFVSDRNGTDDIFSMNPDGTGVALQAGWNDSRESHPRWSPDGTRIAFLSDRGHQGTYTIWVYPDFGGLAKEILLVGVEPQPLEWSADGKRVLFYYNVGAGIAYLHSMDVETLQSELVASNSLLNTVLQPGVAVSPDGARFAYVGLTVGMSFLATANADGTDRKILSQAAAGHWQPRWSR